jgi:Tfp pilus assembly protein PilX
MINFKDERGSVLVLVLIAVMLLSLLGVSALTQSSSDLAISRNFKNDKVAFFTADSGINDGINRLRNSVDPTSVLVPVTKMNQGMSYYSGSVSDTTPQTVRAFTAFDPPPPTGVSIEMGGDAGITQTAWELKVSSKPDATKSIKAKKEIQTAVVTLSAEY